MMAEEQESYLGMKMLYLSEVEKTQRLEAEIVKLNQVINGGTGERRVMEWVINTLLDRIQAKPVESDY